MKRLILATGLWLMLVFDGFGQAIDTAMAIPVGGIRQWISIKGSDRSKPVLLFLHGGPGNSVMGYSDRFTGELRKHFVVVQWDQRESGRTAELNATDRPLTVALMSADAVEVIRFLSRRFYKDKVYLMGHSWGGFLGLIVADQHPELLAAYIPVCPMVHQAESERIALEWMKGKAAAERNKGATEELSLVNIPFGSGEQLYYHRKWLLKYSGGKPPVKEMVVKWSQRWLPLFNEASAYNLSDSMPRIACPVYFFVGGRDYQTSTQLTTDFYNQVEAPEKRLFVFEDTAHNLPTHDPARLQKTIIDEIVLKTGK